MELSVLLIVDFRLPIADLSGSNRYPKSAIENWQLAMFI
jgi:hypothetical protein